MSRTREPSTVERHVTDPGRKACVGSPSGRCALRRRRCTRCCHRRSSAGDGGIGGVENTSETVSEAGLRSSATPLTACTVERTEHEIWELVVAEYYDIGAWISTPKLIVLSIFA